MIIKRAYLPGVRDGEPLVRMVRPGEATKTASAMAPGVQQFIDCLRPDPRYTYVLVNAMGNSWYYGANSNADWYGYNSHLNFDGLLHAWEDIGQNPEADRMKGRGWPYGYPTFYGATVYAHHKNTDPQRLGFGDVQYVSYNPEMKRVELVLRVFNEEAVKKGHTSILNRIRAGERVDVSMGCFKAGAMVSMADGTTKPIEDIVVGDRVRTHTGGTGRVTELHRRKYRGEFFEIKPANSDPLHATVEHPFFAAYDAKDASRVWKTEVPEFAWRYAKDLDGAVLSRPKVTETVSPGRHRGWEGRSHRDLRAFARLIGYYLAEGHVVFNKNERVCGIELTVSKADAVNQEISDLCTAIGTRNEPVWRQRENSPDAWALQIYDEELALICVEYAGRYSKTKRLAEEVLYWPQELQLELLGAYGNGDGFASKDGSFSFSTASGALASQVREILFRLGIPTSHQVLTHKAGTGFSAENTTEHVVFVGRQWAPRLQAFCAKVIVREAKKTKNVFKDYGDLWALPIREYASYSDEADVYNFEVEGDNSYIVNGVAAHNCKVPFDEDSIITDWGLVREAWNTFDPKCHRHPGIAILDYHRKVRPIPGIAVTRAEYSDYMRTQKGQALPDGRRVFVYNCFPRFFDISFVWIGADRTARVMWHLSEGELPKTPVGSASRGRTGPDLSSMLERLLGKTAMMEKEIPDGIAEAVHCDADAMPTMERTTIRIMTNDPRRALSTLAGLGIVLKPTEFQRLVLGDRSDTLSRDLQKVSFDTSLQVIDDTYAVRGEDFDTKLASALQPLMKDRSGFAPYLNPRLVAPAKTAGAQPEVVRNALMDKLAAQYQGYRISVLEQAPELFPKVATYLDIDPLDLEKRSSAGLASILLGAGPVIHFLSSHLRDRAAKGQQLSTMARFVADNPSFTTASTVGGAIRAMITARNAGGAGKLVGKALRTIGKAL